MSKRFDELQESAMEAVIKHQDRMYALEIAEQQAKTELAKLRLEEYRSRNFRSPNQGGSHE